jgi:chromosomal replication initiator protein
MMDEYAILETVAKAFHVTPEAIKGKRKWQRLALARQVAMYLIRENTVMSTTDIGKFLNRDHSTVIHGWKVIALRVADEAPFLWTIGKIRADATRNEHWGRYWQAA